MIIIIIIIIITEITNVKSDLVKNCSLYRIQLSLPDRGFDKLYLLKNLYSAISLSSSIALYVIVPNISKLGVVALLLSPSREIVNRP